MASLAFTASNQQVITEKAADPSEVVPEAVMLKRGAEGLGMAGQAGRSTIMKSQGLQRIERQPEGQSTVSPSALS